MEILTNYSEIFLIICVIILHFYLLASDKWVAMTNPERFMLGMAALFGVLALVGQVMKMQGGQRSYNGPPPQMGPPEQSFIAS